VIYYWAWPTWGRGHATRAAAVCRRLDGSHVVIRGTADETLNASLAEYSVPFIVEEDRQFAVEFVRSIVKPTDVLVLDDGDTEDLADLADVYIWRTGRPHVPGELDVDFGGEYFPVVLLNDDEILSQADAREALGLDPTTPVRIGIPSWGDERLLVEHRPDMVLDRTPALRYMRAAAQIIGAAGLNLVSEVSYLGLRARWFANPRSEDQHLRLTSRGSAVPGINRASAVADHIDAIHRQKAHV